MDVGREARIRVAKEVFGLVVDRWYTAEQVKPELDHYVQSGILQALQDRRLAKLIERVSQLPPAQITSDEVTQIMSPVSTSVSGTSPVEEEQSLQDRVPHQLEQVLGDYNNQDPEVIRMYGMMMQNPPRNDDDLRRFCEYFVTTLPSTSPNRATINRYLSASAPQATYSPQSAAPPVQSRPSTPQQPVQQRPPAQSVQPAPASSRPYASPAMERNRIEPSRRPAPQHETGSLSGAFSGSFPGGCVWLIIYVIGLGLAGAIALLMFGAFLVQNADFYQTEVGQGLGAATGYISTGAGVFFWLRRQASSKLLMARFMVMLFGSAAVLYFVVSSGFIDVNALANSSASDREQLLGIGTMAVSGATTVFLWAKNLLRQLMWLAVLAVIGGGGLAFLFYTGAIDLDALLAGFR